MVMRPMVDPMSVTWPLDALARASVHKHGKASVKCLLFFFFRRTEEEQKPVDAYKMDLPTTQKDRGETVDGYETGFREKGAINTDGRWSKSRQAVLGRAG